MNSLAQAINGFFSGDTTASLGAFMAAMTLIGVATMAVIQAIKDVTPLRRVYQRHRLRRWLREGAEEARTHHAKLIQNESADILSPDLAENDIICLAVDNDRDALYDLALEQMCGQINTALQMVIDYPRVYKRLLLIAGSAATTDDVALLLELDRSQFATPDTAAAGEKRVAYADARNRVAHQLQRAVDGFQIAAAYRWKWSMQLASFGVSVLIAYWAVDIGSGANKQPWLSLVTTAILAGFLAPVARDLAAALQKLRGV